jgi:hypothetical protein
MNVNQRIPNVNFYVNQNFLNDNLNVNSLNRDNLKEKK